MEKLLDYLLEKAVERYKSMNEIEKTAACIILCIIIAVGGFTWLVFKQYNIIQKQREIIRKQDEALVKCHSEINKFDLKVNDIQNDIELEAKIREAIRKLK